MGRGPADTSADTLRRALVAIDGLQRELAGARAATAEPVAVVGIGCRFPGGASDPAAYWRLLADGVDSIGEIPSDRWDVDAFYDPAGQAPGTMTTRWGGFVEDLDRFDAEFFGISPREAEAMDPNQRLVLEVAWEALEDAGRGDVAGTRTGVFVGVVGSDYATRTFTRPEAITPYVATGTAHSVVSGRVAYQLDLRGPAVSVDTACSSSLVAVHLACQSLRAGDCDVALAGGVNVLLSPLPSIAFSQFGMMAPDGRCRTFDERAGGFVRSEGCGMVVLRRLSDAVADGDEVLAVIRGGAINQDGRSAGLTAPNPQAQRDVMRRALRAAAVDPALVSYVEAHGTATSLGDPIEMEALADVYRGDGERPWHLGSVKTNLGHLEAASGVAGLIKVVLALRHRTVPANLHFTELTSRLTLDDPPFVVPVRATPWEPRAGRRVAGVSGFGLSGTNVHLVVEEGPAPAPVVEDRSRPLSVLALSSRTDAGLRALVARHRDHLRTGDVPVADHCWSTATGRARLPRRVAVVGGTAAELASALDAVLAGPTSDDAPVGASVAFLLPGEETFRAGALATTSATSSVVRDVVERCGRALGDDAPAVRDLLLGTADAANDARPEHVAAAAFVTGAACAALWRSWGVEPAAVLGVGVGEAVAAWLAGVVELEQGLALATARGRASDGEDAVARVAEALTARSPQVPWISTVDGAAVPWDRGAEPSRWVRWARDAGRPATAVAALAALGGVVRLEVGPAGAFTGAAAVDDLVPGLRSGDDWRDLLTALAVLHGRGVDVDWAGLDRDAVRRRVPVPLTPFVRSRHWCDPTEPPQPAAAPAPTVVAPDDATAPLTRDALLALPDDERFARLAEHVTAGVAAALASAGARHRSAPPPQVGLDRPLIDLGLDSLMAVGLRNGLRARLGVDVPVSVLLQGATVRSVVERVLASLEDEPAAPAPAGAGATGTDATDVDATRALLDELEALPDDQVRALLEETS